MTHVNLVKGNIITVNKIIPKVIKLMLFHFSQIICRKFKFYGITGKGKYEFNSTLLSNIQILCFIKPELIN